VLRRPQHRCERADARPGGMACYRTATDPHAEKSCSGAGGAGAAAGRVVSGAAAEGRSTEGRGTEGRGTAARQQTCVV
jgi:hypothetical protein